MLCESKSHKNSQKMLNSMVMKSTPSSLKGLYINL